MGVGGAKEQGHQVPPRPSSLEMTEPSIHRWNNTSLCFCSAGTRKVFSHCHEWPLLTDKEATRPGVAWPLLRGSTRHALALTAIHGLA